MSAASSTTSSLAPRKIKRVCVRSGRVFDGPLVVPVSLPRAAADDIVVAHKKGEATSSTNLAVQHVGFACKDGSEGTFLAFYQKGEDMIELPNKLAGSIFRKKSIDRALKCGNRVVVDPASKQTAPVIPESLYLESKKKQDKHNGFKDKVAGWWKRSRHEWEESVASKRLKVRRHAVPTPPSHTTVLAAQHGIPFFLYS
jgi:hypothetical protein